MSAFWLARRLLVMSPKESVVLGTVQLGVVCANTGPMPKAHSRALAQSTGGPAERVARRAFRATGALGDSALARTPMRAAIIGTPPTIWSPAGRGAARSGTSR